MNTALTLIGGTGIGAGLMYLLDPDKGERRRNQLSDRMSTAAEALQATSRDVADRGFSLAEDFRDADLVGRARTLADTFRESDVRGRTRAVGSFTPVRRLGAELGDVIRDPRSFKPRFEGGRLTLRKRSGMAEFL